MNDSSVRCTRAMRSDLVVALVAVLVALVHHRWSYAVILGNTAGDVHPPRQIRRLLRWRVIERD
jgi:hypothetical protein